MFDFSWMSDFDGQLLKVGFVDYTLFFTLASFGNSKSLLNMQRCQGIGNYALGNRMPLADLKKAVSSHKVDSQ